MSLFDLSAVTLPFGTFDLTAYMAAFKPYRPFFVALLALALLQFGWRLYTRFIGYGRGGGDDDK